jgi:hypothetical protein
MLYFVEAHTSIERANAIDAGEGPGPVFGKIGHRKGKHSSERSPHERITRRETWQPVKWWAL